MQTQAFGLAHADQALERRMNHRRHRQAHAHFVQADLEIALRSNARAPWRDADSSASCSTCTSSGSSAFAGGWSRRNSSMSWCSIFISIAVSLIRITSINQLTHHAGRVSARRQEKFELERTLVWGLP